MKKLLGVLLLSCSSLHHSEITKNFEFNINYDNPNNYEKNYILTRHYLRSSEYSKIDNASLATKELETVIKYFPSSPTLKQKYIVELSKSGDFAKALGLIKEIKQKSDELKNVEAWLYMATGELEKSKDIYKEMVYKNTKKNHESCLLLSKLLVLENNFNEATKFLDLCFSKTNNYDFLYEKAALYVANKDTAKAKPILDAIIKSSDNSKALLLLAGIESPKKSLELYQLFLEQNGNDNQAVLNNAIKLALDLKNYDVAIIYLQRAIELDPLNHNYRLYLADIYQTRENYDLAINIYLELQTMFPSSAKINFNLAGIYFRKKEFSKAREYLENIPSSSAIYTAGINLIMQSLVLENDFKKLDTFVAKFIRQNPSLKENIYYNLALIYVDENILDKALVLLSQITLDIEGKYTLAILHDRLGNTNLSVNLLEEILKEDKDHAHALNFLGYIHLEKDSLKLAFDLINRAIKVLPNDPYIQDSMGWYYFKIGNTKEAMTYITNAWEDAKDIEIAKHLAVIYKNDTTRIESLYQEIMQKISDSPERKKLLESIASQRNIASP